MAEQESSTLFYDAECGFCRATVGLVLAWDRGRGLKPVALQDPSAAQHLSGLSEEQRMGSWHLVAPDGDHRSGGAALAPLFETLPRGARLAHLARRFPAAAERLYVLIAENRDRLAKLVPSRLRHRAEETIRRRGEAAARPSLPTSSSRPGPPTASPHRASRSLRARTRARCPRTATRTTSSTTRSSTIPT
jgi:predicted DCC family thiol-disulfide oxidoreductase YuxK